jgi:hypothetical protein
MTIQDDPKVQKLVARALKDQQKAHVDIIKAAAAGDKARVRHAADVVRAIKAAK